MMDISLVFCGEAGQGIQTIEYALTHIIKKAGYYNFATKEYMSRIRGSSNSTEIRISDHKVAAFLDRIDILLLLSPTAFSHIVNRVSPNTIIVGQLPNPSLPNKVYNIDFAKTATNLGSNLYISSIAIGFVLGILKIAANSYEGFFAQLYGAKSKELADKNILAAQEGYKAATEFLSKNDITFSVTPVTGLEKEVLLNGAEALAFGAIAGGCNFISSYPMSPGTGVLSQLAPLSHEFDIIVEQAEDEIAAINMARGIREEERWLPHRAANLL